MKSQEQMLKENYYSRRETLTIMFNRFIETLDKMEPFNAVVFSSPMCECLIHAIHEATQINLELDGDDIINSALKDGN